MKVEVAESLALSWLRHIEGCQLVQLNWKPLPSSAALGRDARAAIEKIKAHFDEGLGWPVVKKTSNAEQFFKQSEVDALGIKLAGAQVARFVAVDVAFHGGGLDYGRGVETPARVAKKLLRSALVLRHALEAVDARIVFATPVASPAIATHLDNAERQVRQFAEKQGWPCTFDVMHGERFRREMFRPVTGKAAAVADTSELFMRAIQLHALASGQP